MTYEHAILDVVRYTARGSQFEYTAIIEVADDHGEDPHTVIRDVKALREASPLISLQGLRAEQKLARTK